MSRPSVYLAGPITGLNYDEATDWRGYAKQVLDTAGIDAFSPLRYKKYLQDMKHHGLHQVYSKFPLSTARGIMVRDRHDCITRDAILVNFLGAERISQGTTMEIAWGDLLRKPMVIAIEDGNINDYPMIRESNAIFLDNLDDALTVVQAILLPGA